MFLKDNFISFHNSYSSQLVIYVTPPLPPASLLLSLSRNPFPLYSTYLHVIISHASSVSDEKEFFEYQLYPTSSLDDNFKVTFQEFGEFSWPVW